MRAKAGMSPNEWTILPNAGPARQPAANRRVKRTSAEIWSEIAQSIRDLGIEDMQVYPLRTCLFMTLDINERFSFAAKAEAEAASIARCGSAKILWGCSNSLSQAKLEEKWLLMERVFKLES
jgi:L-rhamnose mutarotase